MREAGLRIGAGTDSVVSVGSLDLLAEARAARSLGALTAGQALDLVTLGAARSLGLEQEIGTITPGKWADLVALHPEPGPADPEEQALSAGPHDAVLTVCGGRIVHEAALVRDRR